MMDTRFGSRKEKSTPRFLRCRDSRKGSGNVVQLSVHCCTTYTDRCTTFYQRQPQTSHVLGNLDQHTDRFGIAQEGLNQRRSIVLDLNFHLPLPRLRFWSVGAGFNGAFSPPRVANKRTMTDQSCQNCNVDVRTILDIRSFPRFALSTMSPSRQAHQS